MGGSAVWAAALGFVGARFLRHGRDPATGLDCVGLAIAAYRAAGAQVPEPAPYRIGDMGAGDVAAGLSACGFEVAAVPAIGDVVVRRLAARALHLGIRGPTSVVEAHAGLRRVVETPLRGWDGPVTAWRLKVEG